MEDLNGERVVTTETQQKKPKVINLGSINIDYVYQVPHFVRPGETLAATARAVHMGGKGLNQSVAMARAGLSLAHAGRIGADGTFLKEFLEAEGVDVSLIDVDPTMPTGHTVIQVTPEAENSILYFPGTNAGITPAFLDRAFADAKAGDWLVLQNELNGLADIFRAAEDKGLRVIFSPAPWTDEAAAVPFDRIEALIVNETEARGLLGETAAVTVLQGPELLDTLAQRVATPVIIMTMGSKGAFVSYRRHDASLVSVIPALPVEAVDTTGAGDTFTGYAVRAYIEAYSEEAPMAQAFLAGLREASVAAALSVMKPGAAGSIPTLADVEAEVECRNLRIRDMY